MANTDKALQCADCGATFTFTAAEQDFFASKGFVNEPKRCFPCRQARRRRTQGEGGGSGSTRRAMYSAICASCGKEAQVPFQPTGEKPVYCSECFSKVKETAPAKSQSPSQEQPQEQPPEQPPEQVQPEAPAAEPTDTGSVQQ